jgi:hypothetical protein
MFIARPCRSKGLGNIEVLTAADALGKTYAISSRRR